MRVPTPEIQDVKWLILNHLNYAGRLPRVFRHMGRQGNHHVSGAIRGRNRALPGLRHLQPMSTPDFVPADSVPQPLYGSIPGSFDML